MTASFGSMLAHLVDLFGPQASADPTQLYGNLMVSPAGNILMGSLTDDTTNKLQVTGSAKVTANLNFSGTGNRITGDMSNATFSNQLAFQSSTVNGYSSVNVVPNGTGALAQFGAFNQPNPNNSSFLTMGINATVASINSGILGTGSYLPMAFTVGGAERMRVTTAGLVGINATAASIAGTRLMVKGTVAEWPAEMVNSNTNGSAGGVLLMQVFQTASQFVQFFYSGSIVGSITTNGSSTTFGTTSDYRLKENVKPLRSALKRLMRLKPIRYNFKADAKKVEVDGFMAHELAEELPEAVVGEKDKVVYRPVLREGHDPKNVQPHDVLDIEEHIVPQHVDHSKMVPLLTAALQEANQKIEALEATQNEMRAQIAQLLQARG